MAIDIIKEDMIMEEDLTVVVATITIIVTQTTITTITIIAIIIIIVAIIIIIKIQTRKFNNILLSNHNMCNNHRYSIHTKTQVI